MTDTEGALWGEEPNADASYAAPLGRWERVAASGFGVVLTGVGIASVFLGKSDAGSVTLILGGVAFLVVAVIGMSLHRVRLKDIELYFGVRRAQQVSEVSSRLPPGDAARLTQILVDTRATGAYPDSLLVLVDSLLFEARVRDAVFAALKEGERAEPHGEAGVGEPLIHVTAPEGVRVGIFAMFAPTELGSLTSEFDDEFLDVLPRTGTDAVILITCVRDQGYLAALSDRIEQETSLPVAIEQWRPRGESQPLRPSLDRLIDTVLAGQAGPPQESDHVVEIAEQRP